MNAVFSVLLSLGIHANAEPQAKPVIQPPEVTEALLPCGLRVLLSQDASLPVAAVVLAVEVGYEDDPPQYPGLVHALAYHLQQGNRDLAPGEALATVHNVGGFAAMATGPRQVRFTSVVPTSRLRQVLWAEAKRLRFPTITSHTWKRSLQWAASDRSQAIGYPREILKIVHEQNPEVSSATLLGEYDGRKVSKDLSNISPTELANHSAQKFHYARATLVVVAPTSSEELLADISSLFADLPHSPRAISLQAKAPEPPPAITLPQGSDSDVVQPSLPASSEAEAIGEEVVMPRLTLTSSKVTNPSFIWPVEDRPLADSLANIFCMNVNQQKAGSGEPSKSALRCTYEVTPRRRILLLESRNTTDPLTLVRSRILRLKADREQQLMLETASASVSSILFALHTPLALAQYLAMTPAHTNVSVHQPQRTALKRFLELDSLENASFVQEEVFAMFDLSKAILLVPSSEKKL